jgi:penicillin-binding protein 1A
MAVLRDRRVQLVVAGSLIILLVIGVGGLLLATAMGSNATASSSLLRSSMSSKLIASDGSAFANLHGEINRDPVPLAEIPKSLRDAVVAVEDRRFYGHNGLDIRGTARALYNNIRGNRQGGSTITQQLAKNLYFHGRPRSYFTKITETALAFGLELVSSKEQILSRYLNTAYFGRGSYGVQAAARSYFRKDVTDLTLSESAFLAGLIHSPARYDFAVSDAPEEQRSRKAAAVARRNIVLDAMKDVRLVSAAVAEKARAEPVRIEPPIDQKWEHPFYVDAVLRELGVLKNRGDEPPDKRFDFLGSTHTERAQAVYRSGLKIHTALDPKIQSNAERAMSSQLPDGVLPKASAALVTVEPGSGRVRALIGGRDYYPDTCDGPSATNPICRHGKVNLALGSLAGGSGRQAGSSFKPIVLAAALEKGLSLRQTLDGSPFKVRLDENDEWKVENYEGSAGGTMSVVDATVRSVNAAYARLEVQYLGDGESLAGSKKVAEMARKLGISFPTPDELKDRCGDEYNKVGRCTPAENIPAVALGAKEVSPLDMAGAYATFANDGVYARPTLVTKIVDADGKVLYEAEPESRRAISSDTARGMAHVLRQAVERGTGTAARVDGHTVAGKTGTSQMWRDAWFAGYTPELTTVVWMGNPTVESMVPGNGYPRKITGGSYPARLWHEAMAPTLAGREPKDFPAAPEKLFGPPVKLKPIKGEEKKEESTGGSSLGDLLKRERSGERIVVHRECPPGGGNGIRVWKEEKVGDETHIWRSRAVC